MSAEVFLTPRGTADYYKAKYEDVCEKVLAWVKNMRDFDWCNGFQDSLDELVTAAGGTPKLSDRPDYRPPKEPPAVSTVPACENPNIVWGCWHG